MAFETKVGAIKIITYVSIVRDGKILMVEYNTGGDSQKPNWWIPSPEIEFGEHPEERVAHTLEELGLGGEDAKLEEVESFETSAGWNLIFHYLVRTGKDVKPTGQIRKIAWFSLSELPPYEEIAHGKWERNIAAARLSSMTM